MKDKIVPSAPFKNYADIESLAARVKGEMRRIQIDVCDGKYVKNISWPFTEYSKGDFANLIKKPDLDVFLPEWESINYSVDLMVAQPEDYIDTFVAYGVDEYIIHFRSVEERLEIFADIVKKCMQYDLKLFLAIDVKTDLDKFIDFANENIDSISGFQVMGIENIGMQGQEFQEQSLEIVRVLKENFAEKKVLFDGAINDETIEIIRDAGVDVFCVGSFLTQSADLEGNLSYLKSILR